MTQHGGIPGIDPAKLTRVPLAGELVAGDDSAEVRAPYDGRVLGSRARLGSPAQVDRAVAAARQALRDEPLPQWRRAADPGQGSRAAAVRREDFARCIALEAAKPIRTARAEVDRAVSTMQFSAAVARSLAGEVVPLDASQGGEGKFGFSPPVASRGSRRRSRPSTSPSTSWRTSSAPRSPPVVRSSSSRPVRPLLFDPAGASTARRVRPALAATSTS